MAASSSDYFMKVGRATATTLSAPGYTVGNTTINVASTTNYPTDTGVFVAVDEVDSSGERISGTYNVFRGVVSSATQISSLVYQGGDPNRNYAAGATTRVYIVVSSYQMNRLIDGLLVAHNQDGSLKTNVPITTNLATLTTPKIITGINDTNGNELLNLTATSSAVNELTLANAATGNAVVTETSGGDTNISWNQKTKGTGEIQWNGVNASGAWQTWTPSYTNITVGNGTVVAKYKQVGKKVSFRFRLTFGTTTSISTAPTITLPVTAASDAVDFFSGDGAQTVGGTGASQGGSVYILSTTTMRPVSINTNGVYIDITATVPFTWTNTDRLQVSGTYEAA